MLIQTMIVSMFLSLPAQAGNDVRQAAITGSRGNGTCTIEVSVDGAADIDIFGESGTLTTISGQRAAWRRFECNTPLPRSPADFRFVQVGGRGQTTLVREPNGNRGVARIHISDPKSGRGVYIFNLLWRDPGGWPPSGPVPGRGPWQGESGMQTAIRSCQDSVTSRLNQDGYRSIRFENTMPHVRPAGYDLIGGSVIGTRRFDTARFGFSCTANFRSGRVLSVDVRPY
jgi:hypothetical protein